MDRDKLQGLLAHGWSVERIASHLGRHPSTVAYWMQKHALTAVNAERHRARGAIDRTRLGELVARGLSITELARELDRSKSTIRHWLERYGLQTLQTQRQAQRRAVVARARERGREPPRELRMECRLHGKTAFVLEGSGYYRCAQCRSDSVVRHRRKLKEILVAEAGGRCVICGYDRAPRALEFHHVDPGNKDFALSRGGVTLSLSSLRTEAAKCVLLCSNCHAEVESGTVSLAVQ